MTKQAPSRVSQQPTSSVKFSIRLLFLYLFAAIGLVITIIALIQMVELGFKVTVFKDVDNYYEAYPVATDPSGKPIETESAEEIKLRQDRELKRQRESQLLTALSMLIVGLPLYLYHWRLINKENKHLLA